MNVKKSIVAVMIAGFLTIGAGTAHAQSNQGWVLKSTCTDSGDTYKLKENQESNRWGARKCPGGSNCYWKKKNETYTKARNAIPCMD